MRDQPERIAWIDNAKALGLFLVVWGHTSGIDHRSLTVIYAFHMPLFFFLAGSVVKEKYLALPFGEYLRRNARGLLVPYVFFWSVSYLYWLVVAPLKAHHRPWTAPWLGLLYGTGETLDNNVVLWFFTCLFSTAVLFWLIWRIRPRSAAVVVTASLAVVGPAIYGALGFRLPWNVELAMVAVGFYASGFVFRHRLVAMERRGTENASRPRGRVTTLLVNRAWSWRWLLLGVSATIVFVVSRINDRSDMNAFDLGNGLAFYSGALAGILSVVLVSQMVPKNRLATLISENAIAIFPLHVIAFGLLTGLAMYGLGFDKSFKDSWPWSLVYAVYALTACSICAAVLRRFAPWALGVRSPRVRASGDCNRCGAVRAWFGGTGEAIVTMARLQPSTNGAAGRPET